MTPDYNQAAAWVAALTGLDPAAAVLDWRCLHDTDKSLPGHAFRGTLPTCWQQMQTYQTLGFGVFANINEMDGNGRELHNVASIRTHAVDFDNLSASQNFERAQQWQPGPSFGVNTSPGKYHAYWPVQPYRDNDRYTTLQRKLRQVFDGDKSIIDPTRVLRVPGTLHLKNPAAPHLVTCFALLGYGQRYAVETLEQALAHVVALDTTGVRHELGEPSLAAPSLQWLQTALDLSDPNQLDRGEWIALTCAVKQSGWTFGEAVIRPMWDAWCARYDRNDIGENEKQWSSIRATELGWPSLVNRVPQLKPMLHFGGADRSGQVPQQPAEPGVPSAPPMPVPAPPSLDCSGEFLTSIEQKEWFKGCLYITSLGEIMTPANRFLGPGVFNAVYGGKKFIVDSDGKATDEAWKAATRSTQWRVPIVDHIRFLPDVPYGTQLADDMGRIGVNTYKPANIRRLVGDPGPFLYHMAMMFPDPNDLRVIYEYLAHNAKYPGHKIPWAPVIQSTEGAGKGVLKTIMGHVMGRSYTYFPNAHELAKSGAQFNGWMRNKLFILADEIKVDDRKDLIEILKPMISEKLIEVQAKGENQDMEDNVSNWCFFTNYKDAIPVNKNGRRYAIFYTPFQTAADLTERQMGESYFNALYTWLDADGASIVADWLLNYPIERGAIPMRAPMTTSMAEAVRLSRGPVERAVLEAVEDQREGFRGGYVSSLSIARRVREIQGLRMPMQATLETIMQGLGYVSLGRAPRTYTVDSYTERATVWGILPGLPVEGFGRAQGWE
jgi:hypothetical protein